MSNEMIELLIKSFWETGYMVVASTLPPPCWQALSAYRWASSLR